MTDLLAGLIEWGREQNVSPMVAAWLIAGWLVLRALAMVGKAVSATATTMWSRYAEMLRKLEVELTETRHELAVARAERNELARDLERAEAMNELLQEQARRARLKLFRNEGDEE